MSRDPRAPDDLPSSADTIPASVARDLKREGHRIGGAYSTDHQAPGAIPNGSQIRKCKTEEGDANPIGTLGIIQGSLGPIPPGEKFAGMYAYFVRWETMPEVAVLVVGWKLEPA